QRGAVGIDRPFVVRRAGSADGVRPHEPAAMMRGLRPLFAVAVFAVRAQATEMIEIPTPTPTPTVACCIVVEPRPDPRLLVAVDGGPTGRTAFGPGFAGAAIEVTLGGERPKLSLAGRVRADFAVTVDLRHEHVGAGGSLV